MRSYGAQFVTQRWINGHLHAYLDSCDLALTQKRKNAVN
jgi:hypothetical protein